MDKKSIFEFHDYKAYLRHTESQRPMKGRGFRAELARAVHCQTAYVSQVFNGHAQFSLEHAQFINELLLHNKEQSRFFILLVEYARAGTAELKEHFADQMSEQIQKQLNLKDRFKVKDVLTLQDQTTYYSEWGYAAIHVAVSVSQLNSVDPISEAFQLPKQKVQKILDFLATSGLIATDPNGTYKVGNARLHLGHDSPLVSKHHANWRLQAMNSYERETERDLHYTSIVSLSNKDVLEIKARFVKEIESYNAIVKDSKEETAYCLALDFFSIKKN